MNGKLKQCEEGKAYTLGRTWILWTSDMGVIIWIRNNERERQLHVGL